MEPTRQERDLSRVACLIDELNGKKIDSTQWDGFHPRVYGQNVDNNALVLELCSRLQNVDVTKYSLEMQIWWRDHQIADKKRVKEEVKKAKEQKDLENVLAKLTPYERKLLKQL